MEQLFSLVDIDLGIKFSKIFITLIITFILTHVLKKVSAKYIQDTTSKYKTRKLVNLIGYIIVICAVLIIFSSQLNGLTVFIGVAGAGITFALQEVIISIAGFIVIHSSNFYKVGDRVLVAGIKGDVIDIGFLRTSIMELGDWVNGDLYNGKITRVANSFIFKEPVSNYSGEFPFLWDELTVPIKTDSDFVYARAVFLDILNETNGEYADKAKVKWDKMRDKLMVEDARVEPMISMKFDENWITFTLRYVVDFKSRRGTKDKLYTKLLTEINNSNGRIEVASAAYEVTNLTE